jgi:hypothetical protein
VIDTVLVLPTPRALLPPLSQDDPVADLRAACTEAVAGLPAGDPLVVVAVPTDEANLARGVKEPLGHRVALHLLGPRPFQPELALPWTAASLLEQGSGTADHPLPSTTLVVMADGSARRTEKAPGHLHPDAVAFDDALERALRDGDADALAQTDLARAEEVWCQGAPGFRLLGEVALGRHVDASLTYADAPYGVSWWVARWDLTGLAG